MAMEIGQMGYDKGGGFSPDGRLFQVEYARKAVERGTTVLGIEYQGGVALFADKRITSRLLKIRSVQKIFQVDEHIGATTSGLVADARMLIDVARVQAQTNRATYNDEPIDVETLTKKVCDYQQAFTQYNGIRPFGAALLIAGVYDKEKYLFETDPSGALLEYEATAIGSGKDVAIELFEQKHKEGMEFEDAILLGLEALYKVTEGEVSNETVDIAFVSVKTGKFESLDSADIEVYIEKIKSQQEEK